jgi:GH25 family lysozyme M1 (1,4-beta-N-acetylmuramidase)
VKPAPFPVTSRSAARLALVAACLLVLIAPVAASGAAGDGSAGTSGTAALDPAIDGPAAARAAATLPGIDVSHWQGVIDWPRVAGAGRLFAFMKSTDGKVMDDGKMFVDPRFTTNRAGAKANGLRVGMYHFARPGPEAGDAIREARHFVRTTRPVAGELLPVLDIESTGGLDPTGLTTWARRWVREVKRLTGVTALVYTSPYFWKTYHGDTRSLAREGSLLWIAHWTSASSPTVPAANWDGRGWVVWQHSSTGRVPGISGNVDLNRFQGTDLGAITIRRLVANVTGEGGRIRTEPTGLTCRAPATCTRNVDPNATITVRAVPDDGAYFTGWGGACEGTALTCTITMRANRQVTAGFVTDITPPTATIAPPSKHGDPIVVAFDEIVRGVSPTNVVLRHGGAPVPATRTCRSGTGEVVPCATGNVRRVQLRAQEPLVPGAAYRTVVNPQGVPRVRDRVGNPAATTSIRFDAPLGVEEHEPPAVQRWRTGQHPDAFGGTFAVERLAGAELSFSFGGPTVTWYAMRGRAYGKAEVLIDGRSRGVVDLYAPAFRARVGRTFDGLGAGRHTITIRALGAARAGATDRLVTVDAFGTRDGIVRTPITGERWRRVQADRASGGSYAVAELPGSSVTLRFRGSGVDWTTVTGPDRGRARLFVDGALVRTVDLYSLARSFGEVRRVAGLPRGVHTLRIVVTGTSRPAATGAIVAVDRFDVHP